MIKPNFRQIRRFCVSVCVLALAAVAAAAWLPGTPARADQPLDLSSASGADATLAPRAQGLAVDFGDKTAWPNVSWKAPSASGWNWSAYAALVLTMTNPGAQDQSFHVRIDDVGANDKGHATTVNGSLAAGKTQTFFVSLTPRSEQEASGMRALPSPADPAWGVPLGAGVEPSDVRKFQIFLATPKAPVTLIVDSLMLAGKAAPTGLIGLVDRYGQYAGADWPNKIHDDADFQAQKTAEDADLKAHPGEPGRDRWGGWSTGPRESATGFFRTQQIDGKWWLVDPDGRLFLTIGMDVVRPRLSTTIAGRQQMFRWLPASGDPLAVFYGGGDSAQTASTYNFIAANLRRKYGPDADALFGGRAVERLKSWGFNSLGNWSVESIGQQNQFPYVVAASATGNFATVPVAMPYGTGKMPDPYDPAFAAAVDAEMRQKAPTFQNDPACIGYFFDNELPWGMPTGEQHDGLCYGTLSLGPESPAKRAFVAFLQSRYPTINAFDAAWGVRVGSWNQLSAPYRAPLPVQSDTQRRDFSAFQSRYADQYFSTVSAAIKRYDPNHLYLGCRFAYWFTPEAVESAAKYADVISFNIYNWNRQTYLFAETLGKPCVVGEFHFGATDRGMFSGDVTVASQKERGTRYEEYVKDVLSEPAFVGCQWFEYYDEPTTGRAGDGENFNIGFLSTTDTPYPELIAASRAAAKQVYRWH